MRNQAQSPPVENLRILVDGSPLLIISHVPSIALNVCYNSSPIDICSIFGDVTIWKSHTTIVSDSLFVLQRTVNVEHMEIYAADCGVWPQGDIKVSTSPPPSLLDLGPGSATGSGSEPGRFLS